VPVPPPRPAPPEKRHTVVRSFRWAFTGLVEAAQRERNLRIHLALGVLASMFAAVAPLAAAERALLLLAVALVVAAEAANSALEAVVDLVSPGFDERARVAKDAAAGAVLALSAGSVVLFAAIAAPAVPALRAAGAGLAHAALGAAVAALAAGLLPADRPRRGRWPDAALAAFGALGIVDAARFAESHAGTAAAALLLGLAAAAALRRHRRR
jgi:diacylglycerol kinase (ATP)